MSGQGTPCRMQKSSPNLQKQGPLKATIPMSSVMKQNTNLKSSSSATVSPTYLCKNRISPEQSSGQRSPGSSCKGTSKTLECGSIRRTASLDTIYLKGHWPRDLFYWHLGTLQIDKATQTDESDNLDEVIVQSISENSEKLEKLPIRPVIRGSKDSGGRHGSPGENTLNSSSQTLASFILSPTFKPSAINVPAQPLPKPSMRSSVEGLNQEIERIVLKTGRGGEGRGEGGASRGTPEGHRAPLAELLRGARSRSANTPREGSGGSRSSEDSQGSSPDQETSKLGSSPQINKFLAREPPDGCEKVHSKSLDDRRSFPLPHVSQPPSTFKLKPSLGSAFQSLQPSVSEALDRDLPLVPSRRDDK
ncbi:unnamed protein product [Phaedon cochleariae]|uniref:Uncharacterized protein n=1 Tax=Phaedon cochleariae TaxID=80249 RepID=A0A9N9X1H1_PHACE|nr:unnamed protein product [Phaedon cochleariae]